MQPISEIITRMRLATHRFRPYLARLIYSMPMHEVSDHPDLTTLAVDQHGRCYFNPEYLRAASVEQGAYLLLHEAMHVMLRHCLMMRQLIGINPSPDSMAMANIAVDLVVEQLLRGDLAAHLPQGGVTCEQFGFPPNLSASEYYRLLEDLAGDSSRSNSPCKESSHGTDNQDSVPTQPEDVGESPEGHQTSDDGGRKPAPVDGQRDCHSRQTRGTGDTGDTGGHLPDRRRQGASPQVPSPAGRRPSIPPGPSSGGGSCADGVPRKYEEPPDPTWESHRQDATFQAVEQAIEQHEKQHGVGSVPGQLKLAISGKLRPQPNPWDVLRSAVSSSVSTPVGAPEMTYRRFSRRQQPDLPRLKGRINSQPTAVVILDTSGSMCSGDDQAKALTVIAQGLARLSSFRVFAGDTRVCSDKRVSALSQIEWAGGGGTDMATLIEEVDRKHHPDSIVLVTDGYTPWPKHRPRARVVVALTRPKQDGFPKWARGIEVGGDATR